MRRIGVTDKHGIPNCQLMMAMCGTELGALVALGACSTADFPVEAQKVRLANGGSFQQRRLGRVCSTDFAAVHGELLTEHSAFVEGSVDATFP